MWHGTARTNYVSVTDLEKLGKILNELQVRMEENHQGQVCFVSDAEDGGWSGMDEQDREFSFEEHVMPYVVGGQVLVAMEAGADKCRYISGRAVAYVRWGDRVEQTCVELADIYEKAKKFFVVADITDATY